MKKLILIIMVLLIGFMPCQLFAEESAEPSEWEKWQKESQLAIEKDRLALEREKWEWDKAQDKKTKYESQFSSLIDIKRNPPVFEMFSTIADSDRRFLRKDLSILYEGGCRKVIINISSYGGGAMDGLGVANVILEFRKKGMEIEGRAYGKVCSAAVPIFAVCSERISGPSTLFMVHEAAMWKFFAMDTHKDIRSQKEMMDKLQKQYINLLVQNSDMDYDFWLSLESKTTWFNADQARDWGLVDRIE